MVIQQILETKGTQVHTVAPEASLREAAVAMMDHHCGSLVVLDHGRVVGIITERDLLRATAHSAQPLDEIPVETKMTRDVLTGRAQDKISYVMGLLTERRVRHLPIVDDAEVLIGMISIGDVVKTQYVEMCRENHFLKEYVQG
jgi:CBS domain-containing protein